MQGGSFERNVSSRAHEAHKEMRADFLTDVFSSIFSLPRTEENPMWAHHIGPTTPRNSRERLFKSSWRQFGLLSGLDDKTMQECVSCMKVRRYCDCVDANFRVVSTYDIQKNFTGAIICQRCNHHQKWICWYNAVLPGHGHCTRRN